MRNVLILVVAIAALAAMGCGGSKTDAPASPISQCLNGAPDWVIAGGAEGGFTSIGAAQISKAGMQFARTAAMASARDEMARSISIKVNNMLKDFTQSTGIGDDEVVDKVTANVSKQVASQTLNGTVQRSIWQSPCNELYVLIASDPAVVQAAVKQSVNSSYRNENALWQQFQAQKAQDELDAAISKEFPR